MTWDERHPAAAAPRVDPWLASLGPLLCADLPGPILDVACGRGQNALWVAETRGAAAPGIAGVDASEVAVALARSEALRRCLSVRFEARDVSLQGLPPGDWGAILVFHFLDRSLFPLLETALAPGGLLVYKTHLRHPLRGPVRPHRPSFLLEPGELVAAFPSLRTVDYREWAAPGRSFATLLARRPLAQSR